jgi:hypothetical protein
MKRLQAEKYSYVKDVSHGVSQQPRVLSRFAGLVRSQGLQAETYRETRELGPWFKGCRASSNSQGFCEGLGMRGQGVGQGSQLPPLDADPLHPLVALSVRTHSLTHTPPTGQEHARQAVCLHQALPAAAPHSQPV